MAYSPPPSTDHPGECSMSPSFVTGLRSGISSRIVLAVAALALAAGATAARAEHPVTTLATLLDRTQIEDLLVDYYGQLGSGRRDFGAYYAEDGVLDVNGLVAQGPKAIEELYRKVGSG